MFDIDLNQQTQALRTTLARDGVRAALALLNDRTDFRYTALYRLHGRHEMRLAHAFDRTREYRTWLNVVPLDQSLSRLAFEQGEFVTRSASTDPRLTERRHAALVESYYGRPVDGKNGRPWGIFIHFDLEPCGLPDEEAAFLRQALPLLSDYLE